MKRKSSGCTKHKDGKKQIGFPSWQGDPLCEQNEMSCDGRVGKIHLHHLCNCLESGGTLWQEACRCMLSWKQGKMGAAGKNGSSREKWEQRVGKRKGEHCILRGAVIVVVGRRERWLRRLPHAPYKDGTLPFKGAPGCRPVTRGRGRGGVHQSLKKFNIHASKIYPRGPVATPNASAAPLIELDR